MFHSRKSPVLAAAGVAVAGAAVVDAVASVGATAFAIRALRSQPFPDDAVVLITGGSRGLGLAIASRFAGRPVRLVLAARNRDELERAPATFLDRTPTSGLKISISSLRTSATSPNVAVWLRRRLPASATSTCL